MSVVMSRCVACEPILEFLLAQPRSWEHNIASRSDRKAGGSGLELLELLGMSKSWEMNSERRAVESHNHH